MARNSWRDHIVGDRMAVDQKFTDQIAASGFSRQEWGLIMTAVEFEIENPADEENARIVANTDKLEHILPELENIKSQMAGMGGAKPQSRSEGFFSSVKSALGMGEEHGVDEQTTLEAERLTQEYADELQDHLEQRNKWDQVRQTAER